MAKPKNQGSPQPAAKANKKKHRGGKHHIRLDGLPPALQMCIAPSLARDSAANRRADNFCDWGDLQEHGSRLSSRVLRARKQSLRATSKQPNR